MKRMEIVLRFLEPEILNEILICRNMCGKKYVKKNATLLFLFHYYLIRVYFANVNGIGDGDK
jgi:hypothetical protein